MSVLKILKKNIPSYFSNVKKVKTTNIFFNICSINKLFESGYTIIRINSIQGYPQRMRLNERIFNVVFLYAY